MTRIKSFNPNRPTRIGSELAERYRYNLGLHAQRLLLGLAQSLDLTLDLFPLWEVDIRSLFQYLAIENNNNRYNIVREALSEIHKNPLEYKKSEKNWGSYSWLTEYHFNDEDSKFVKIQFADAVKPFLLNLKQYVELKPKHYLKLGTPYATWIYPMLKNQILQSKKHFKAKEVVFEISIEKLREKTFTDGMKSYDEATNFLVRVVGIKRKRNSSSWEIVKESGALWDINEFTDLNVRAEALKKGRAYDRVKFWVSLKESESEQRKSVNGRNVMKEKYPATFDLNKNKNIVKRFNIQTLRKNAEEAGLTLERYAQLAGYRINGEYAYKT
jgi:plasmid replication initiation protein